jgi:DNA-binding LacI/PurR family transcriptional regulator
MTDGKNVLVVGLDPYLIDFSKPGYPPGMTAPKVMEGLKACEQELTGLGYNVQMCYTDFGETAEAVLQDALKQKHFDCVLIGAGVRSVPSNLLLFEKLINVVHEHAHPKAKLCFNSLPNDVTAAIKRWI